MAIQTPRIEFSDAINETSARIGAIDRRLQHHLYTVIELDTKLREEVGLAQDVALDRLSVLKTLFESGRRDVDFENANKSFAQKLEEIRDDYVENHKSLLKARSTMIVDEREVSITASNRDQLLDDFKARLDACLQPYFAQPFNRYETEIRREIRELEEKIAERETEITRLFDERTWHTTEAFRPSPEQRELLQEREQLRAAHRIDNPFLAAQMGDIAYIQRVLSLPFYEKNRITINQRDSRGFTLLQIAAFCGQVPTVGFLLGRKASVKYVDIPNKYEPIHWAAWAGHTRIVELLIEHGAKVDALGSMGRTPLHIATFKHKLAIADFLLKNGADINAQTNDEAGRETSLHQVVTNNDEQMADLLCKSALLDLNRRTVRDYTPLYMAVHCNLPNMVRKIIRHPNFFDSGEVSDPSSLISLIESAKRIKASPELIRLLEKKLYGKATTPKEPPAALVKNDSINRMQKTPTLIHGEMGTYALLNRISSDEAEALLDQYKVHTRFVNGIRKAPFFFGQGFSGKARLARDVKTGKFIVVKKIDDPKKIERAQNEARIQMMLSGKPNILPILDSILSTGCTGEPKLYLFFPIAGYGDGDSLIPLLQKCPEKQLAHDILTSVALDIARGMEGMHSDHVIHADFKTDNFVIQHTGEAQIIDFGTARELPNGLLDEGIVAGTKTLSPERIQLHAQIIGKKTVVPIDARAVDAWSLGQTLFELINGDNPFAISSEVKKYWSHTYMKRIAEQGLRKDTPEHLRQVVIGLLDPDPKTRMTVAQALEILTPHSPFANENEKQAAFQRLKYGEEAPAQASELDSDDNTHRARLQESSGSSSDDNDDRPVAAAAVEATPPSGYSQPPSVRAFRPEDLPPPIRGYVKTPTVPDYETSDEEDHPLLGYGKTPSTVSLNVGVKTPNSGSTDTDHPLLGYSKTPSTVSLNVGVKTPNSGSTNTDHPLFGYRTTPSAVSVSWKRARPQNVETPENPTHTADPVDEDSKTPSALGKAECSDDDVQPQEKGAYTSLEHLRH